MPYSIIFLNKFHNVSSYQVLNEKLFCLNETTLKIFEKNELLITIKKDFGSIYKVDDILFSGYNFYYDTSLNEIKELNKISDYYYSNIYYGSLLVFANNDIVLFSLIENEIVKRIDFKLDCSICVLFKNMYIGRGENFYSCFTINDDTSCVWKHSFSDLLEGEEIETVGEIIVHDGSLFFPLKDNKNNKHNATFEIDIETGIVKNIYSDFFGKLILNERRLYIAHYYEVKKLTIETKETIVYNFEDILKPLNLQIHWNKSVIESDKLYFIDGHWATTNRMGIIDLNTKQLIWQKDFEIDDEINNSIIEIKVSANRMYVHCSDKSLYVFEKE